ncbi:MAG: RNA polymerase sigma factor [bacterium]|nr:RNA polymerase sigma factor [bacterium]
MRETNELFWELLTPHYQAIGAFCSRLTADPDSGNDLLHDALMIGLRSFPNLRETGSFRPWLYRIVVTTYRAEFRRPWWKKRVTYSEELTADLKAVDSESSIATRRWLERGLDALNPAERATILLYELQGWTVAELAELLNRSESAVKTELHRSRKKMKKRLVAFIDRAEKLGQSSKRTEREIPCVAAKSKAD